MNKLDWKSLGQMNSAFLNLYTNIRDTLIEKGVGIEIVGWLLGEGKKSFVSALEALGSEYVATQRVRVISKNVIMVNLDAPPKLPFEGAVVEANTGGGWVKVENRRGELCVAGRKIILHLEDGQKDDKVMGGHKLRDALTGKAVEHPNVLDALLEHPHLIPESWKVDEQGRTRYVFFWAVVYRDSQATDASLYVRCLFFRVAGWHEGCRWLDGGWRGRPPAALRAST